MLTNDFLPLTDGRRETTTRRRLLQMAAALPAAAPLAALTAGGPSGFGCAFPRRPDYE